MIVVHDTDGTPIYANEPVLDYTGLTIDDVTRPDLRLRTIHPEDFERLRDFRQAALLRGLPFEIEQRSRVRTANIAGSSIVTTHSAMNRDA
jgi:PAS domain-containing protein